MFFQFNSEYNGFKKYGKTDLLPIQITNESYESEVLERELVIVTEREEEIAVIEAEEARIEEEERLVEEERVRQRDEAEAERLRLQFETLRLEAERAAA